MPDLQERLVALASEGVPRGADLVLAGARRSLDGTPVAQPLVPQKRLPRAALVGIAIVVVLAVVGSSLLLLRDPSGSPSNLVPVVPNENPYRDLFESTPARPGDPTTFLVPGYLPAGMQPIEITGGDRPGQVTSEGGSPSVKREQIWVRLDAVGSRPAASLTLSWGPGAAARIERVPPDTTPPPTDPLAGIRDQGTPIELRGTTGYYNAQRRYLAWEEPPGQLVSITATTLDRADMVAMAEALERHGEDFTVAEAPAGFVQVTDDPGTQSFGSNARTMTYQADGRGLQIRLADAVDRSPGAALSDVGPSSIGADPHIVGVRGHHAVVTRIALNGGGTYSPQTMFMIGANQVVEWREPKGVSVTVSGVGLSEAEVLAVARDLEATDLTGWTALVAQAPGRTGGFGSAPSTQTLFKGEEGAVAQAFHDWIDRIGKPGATTADIEGGQTAPGSDGLAQTFADLFSSPALPPRLSVDVTGVRIVQPDRALVRFSILSNGQPKLSDQQGGAVKIDGRWRVSRSTFCSVIALVNVRCPAP
jgi:hypothetical protein